MKNIERWNHSIYSRQLKCIKSRWTVPEVLLIFRLPVDTREMEVNSVNFSWKSKAFHLASGRHKWNIPWRVQGGGRQQWQVFFESRYLSDKGAAPRHSEWGNTLPIILSRITRQCRRHRNTSPDVGRNFLIHCIPSHHHKGDTETIRARLISQGILKTF